MKKLNLKEFDSAALLVKFVNENQINKEDIVLIERLPNTVCYNLFWF